MPNPVRRALVTTLVIAAGVTAWLLAQSAQENAADVDRLVKALAIQPGSIVGEIGAGDGTLTVLMAKAVGSSGRVLSTELVRDRLDAIRKAARDAGLSNVEVIEGRAAETNLPDQCCDAVFMRNVYHHFGDPPAMNASIQQSLKPGGHLAVIDFSPPGADSAEPGKRSEDGQHGVTAATVERELQAVGFEIVSSASINTRGFMVVARRATSASPSRGTRGTAGDSSRGRTPRPRLPRG
jgi:ubiquinone/menaquinone biosynthesis C-methylase UbiE